MSQSTLSVNELELYRLLEYAKLGQYFTNFLIKGGDDVSQLAEASKDEFDEIIDMVGMMQKPLHIRRLQKALKEWMKDPNGILSSNSEITVPHSAKPYLKANQNLVPRDKAIKSENEISNTNHDDNHMTSNNIFMSQPLLTFSEDDKDMSYGCQTNMMSLPPLFNGHVFPSPNNGRPKQMDICNGIPVSLLPNAVLSSYEKSKIRLAAENLAQTLPVIETRLSSTGRKDVNKGVMNILSMSKDDPNRETQIYNYSAIYGRFNAPRRTGKPMNHHEVSVNEAAAQLSLQIPELITRRDNLFHLARQVVKMAEEIQDDSFLLSKLDQKKEDRTVLEKMQMEEMEKQITDIKSEIEHLLLQETNIRDSYRDAKQNNQGLLMNELQKRLDDTLNQLNNKFTEQTSLATKIMLLKAGSLFGEATRNKDFVNEKTEVMWPLNISSQGSQNTLLNFTHLPGSDKNHLMWHLNVNDHGRNTPLDISNNSGIDKSGTIWPLQVQNTPHNFSNNSGVEKNCSMWPSNVPERVQDLSQTFSHNSVDKSTVMWSMNESGKNTPLSFTGVEKTENLWPSNGPEHIQDLSQTFSHNNVDKSTVMWSTNESGKNTPLSFSGVEKTENVWPTNDAESSPNVPQMFSINSSLDKNCAMWQSSSNISKQVQSTPQNFYSNPGVEKSALMLSSSESGQNASLSFSNDSGVEKSEVVWPLSVPNQDRNTSLDRSNQFEIQKTEALWSTTTPIEGINIIGQDLNVLGQGHNAPASVSLHSSEEDLNFEYDNKLN